MAAPDPGRNMLQKCCKYSITNASPARRSSLRAQPPHGGPSEPLVETRDDQLRQEIELLREHRRGARDGDHAVALGLRHAARSERLTGGRGPHALDLGEERGGGELRGEALERGRDG